MSAVLAAKLQKILDGSAFPLVAISRSLLAEVVQELAANPRINTSDINEATHQLRALGECDRCGEARHEGPCR